MMELKRFSTDLHLKLGPGRKGLNNAERDVKTENYFLVDIFKLSESEYAYNAS